MPGTVRSLPAKRLIGIGFDDKPIYAPKPSHSLLLAAAGSRKITCGAVPWFISLMAEPPRTIIVNDCKDGEIAAANADHEENHGPGHTSKKSLRD